MPMAAGGCGKVHAGVHVSRREIERHAWRRQEGWLEEEREHEL